MKLVAMAAVVVAADTAVLVGAHRGGLAPWVVAAYALAAALVIAVRYRSPLVAFVAAALLASVTDASYVLLLWAAYQAGRSLVSRTGTAVIVGAALGWLAVTLTVRVADPREAPRVVSAWVVFVALPLLVGRYLAQHERLVSVLDQHNRRLRRERDLLAEQERLRERLRIARDMHDSLGHRLSLVSIQAAALEVSALPEPQQQAVRQLAGAARGAVDEMHELVGTLRAAAPEDAPGAEAIGGVVAEFQAAGVAVTWRQTGRPRPLSAAADQAAYRIVEEGLTNAAKHAPGRAVTVTLDWEDDDALRVTVVNPLLADGAGSGSGLDGLDERVRLAGGFLDHGRSGEDFRLIALLPAAVEDELPAVGRVRAAALGVATAALMFVVLPAGMLLGVA